MSGHVQSASGKEQCYQRDRPKTFFKNIRNYFREYCNCTSIHGFRYFGEKRTICERIWWFWVFIICLAACVYSILEVYKKWDRSPVIVSFATRGTPIYKIPFPAVTVCPEAKTQRVKFNFTDVMLRNVNNENVTEDEQRNFEYLTPLCNRESKAKYTNSKSFNDDFYDVIHTLKPKFKIWGCRYMGRKNKCEDLFTPILTDEGVCYTFNMLDRSDIYQDNVIYYQNYHQVGQNLTEWTMDYGYNEDSGMDAYPRRALLAGAKNALSFNLVTWKNDTDYACKDYQGYRVLLHTPMRIPRPSQDYFRIPLDQAIVGVMQPNMITTSDSVKVYPPQKRECYFPSERPLYFYKIYTSLNCQLECLTNYTLSTCGCVAFFMPRTNGTNICGTGKMKCMSAAEMNLQMKDVKKRLDTVTATKSNRTKTIRRERGVVECDCLPISTDLTYDVETSQIDWQWDQQFRSRGYKYSKEISQSTYYSSLTIYFKSSLFITSQRHELYGPTDFLANFGGLLGLFTGFSVLSLMEIFYFLSLRLICNTKLYGYWSGVDTQKPYPTRK